MKKPDAKRQRPGLQRGFDSLLQDDDSAKVARVIQRLTGKKASETASEPQNFRHQLRSLLMKSPSFHIQLRQKLLQ